MKGKNRNRLGGIEGQNANNQFNSDMAWQKLHARLEADNLLRTAGAKRVGIGVGTRTLLHVAAAVALVLVLAGVATFYLNRAQVVQIANNVRQTTKVTILPDGSSVFLAYGSNIEYPKNFRGKIRAVKLSGEAFFDVEKNPDRPFVINTQKAKIKVLGTSFNLKAEQNSEVVLNVVEGKVSIELIDIPTSQIVAVAGENVVSKKSELVKATAEMMLPRQTIVKMQFQDETVQQVVTVINKVYGSNIVVEGVDLQNKVISVMFENDINSIVEILSQSFGLHKDVMPDGSIILSW